jgi:SAM-dependent methyltransferase
MEGVMQTTHIQRQYDEVIAAHYDRDPQSVLGGSLERAMAQMRRQPSPPTNGKPLKVLDVGMGTGRFLQKFISESHRFVEPFGLDLSEKMIDVARARLPNLQAVVADAETLDLHFPDQSFDLIATHFVTGFVPAAVLAPKIWHKLAPGGCWSLVGGTKQGFPNLQKKARSRILQWMFGHRHFELEDLVCNPTDQAEVAQTLQDHGFAIREAETFRPELYFPNLNGFLEFAYYGGWLTPFVESLGLHRAKPMLRLVLNTFVFPLKDNHSIAVVLAQKGGGECAS